MDQPTRAASSAKPHALYAALEERILARDQPGASARYYDLLRAGRPIMSASTTASSIS
jgi:hypothetical protein